MRSARLVTALILTAHGSADPRSATTTHAIAALVRDLRPGLEVTAAFCEQNSPNLSAVLANSAPGAVVVPLLLADAYHARVDIPAMIHAAGVDVRRADVLGEDDRLIELLRQRLVHAGIPPQDGRVGVLVTAVGSSRPDANARTASVAERLTRNTGWATATAFATGPAPGLAETAHLLSHRGATRLVVAPWFLAPGRITDRVADFARTHGHSMSAPLGAHPRVAETVLDRFDAAVALRLAA